MARKKHKKVEASDSSSDGSSDNSSIVSSDNSDDSGPATSPAALTPITSVGSAAPSQPATPSGASKLATIAMIASPQIGAGAAAPKRLDEISSDDDSEGSGSSDPSDTQSSDDGSEDASSNSNSSDSEDGSSTESSVSVNSEAEYGYGYGTGSDSEAEPLDYDDDEDLIRTFTELNKRYAVGVQLGAGAFGAVRLCTEKTTQRSAAVKILDKRNRKMSRSEIFDEIDLMRSLHHPGIVELYDVLEDNNYIYVVTEVLSGGELLGRLIDTEFTEALASEIFIQICGAVHYMHTQGIVHRDLKCENILMQSKKTNIIKIVDFGLGARNMDAKGRIVPLTDKCGTPDYMAPEVFRRKPYNQNADWWSCGVILFVMTTGKIPWPYDVSDEEYEHRIKKAIFDFPNNIHLSEECKDLIRSLLTPDPDERLSGEAVLRHPWFKTAAAKTTPLAPEVKEGLRRIRARHRWKEAIDVVRSVVRMKILLLDHHKDQIRTERYPHLVPQTSIANSSHYHTVKTAIITGGTSAIGKALAIDLLKHGYKLFLTTRSKRRGDAALDALLDAVPEPAQRPEFMEMDLSSNKSVFNFVCSFVKGGYALDCIVCCAATYQPALKYTVDGVEITMAVNHFGHFLLLSLLHEAFRQGPPVTAIMLTICLDGPEKANYVEPETLRGEAAGRKTTPKLGAHKSEDTDMFHRASLANAIMCKEFTRKFPPADSRGLEKTDGRNFRAYALYPGHFKSDLGTKLERSLFNKRSRQKAPHLRVKHITDLIKNPTAVPAGSYLHKATVVNLTADAGLLAAPFRTGASNVGPPKHKRAKDIGDRLWYVAADVTDLYKYIDKLHHELFTPDQQQQQQQQSGSKSNPHWFSSRSSRRPST